jgi:uncharacterized DUF497 family protein
MVPRLLGWRMLLTWLQISNGTVGKPNPTDPSTAFPSTKHSPVFADPFAKIFDDVDRSATKSREIIIGHSLRQRLLLVCFIAKQDIITIISARKATRRERQDYEENVKS